MQIDQFFTKWFWKKLKTDVFCFFNPQQKWLTKNIPNTWIDKDYLIELVLFESIVHFVEQEKGCEHHSYDWSDELAKGYVTKEYVDELQKVNCDILTVYNYIKNERPKLQQQIENLEISGDTIKTYLSLEEDLTKLDTRYLSSIVKLRHYIWT